MSSEKSAMIKNPLTIIAIFAGIAEISGTIVLPQLESEHQAIFMWFVMAFPLYLVGLFFYVLWHKHEVLYAPSDFRDESHFRDLAVPATVRELAGKADKEKELEKEDSQPADGAESTHTEVLTPVETQAELPPSTQNKEPVVAVEKSNSVTSPIRAMYRKGEQIGDGAGNWMDPEELVNGAIFSAAGTQALHLSFGTRVGDDFENWIFDAVLQKDSELVGFEGLIASNFRVVKNKMRFLVDTLRAVHANLPEPQKSQLVLVVALVYLPYVPQEERNLISNTVKSALASLPFRTHIRKIAFETAFINGEALKKKIHILGPLNL